MKLRVGGWFRHYNETLLDPKVQRLSDRQHRILMGLWELTSMHGGRLPALPDIAFFLRVEDDELGTVIGQLRQLQLIDQDENGTLPHNWNARQQSDSAERVKRHRRRRNGAVTVVKRPCNDNVTAVQRAGNGEDLRERKEDISIASQSQGGRAATRTAVDQSFAEFWQAYPRRDGANPKAPAAKRFAAALRSGTDPAAIVAGARRYREACDAKKLTGTPMVAQALTWLTQERWADYPAGAGNDNGLSADAQEFVRMFGEKWKREAANGRAAE
jgi:hypothetical protein